MIYLVHYDRSQRALLLVREFADEDSEQATQAKLQIELDRLGKAANEEIVLLSAASAAVLRETHGRYFRSVAEMGVAWRLALGVE